MRWQEDVDNSGSSTEVIGNNLSRSRHRDLLPATLRLLLCADTNLYQLSLVTKRGHHAAGPAAFCILLQCIAQCIGHPQLILWVIEGLVIFGIELDRDDFKIQ